MTEKEFHPAANIFPLEEYRIGELAADVKAHGLHIPIETLGGKILDGRRRYLACRQARVEPTYRAVSPADPVAYVLSLNLHRRHLDVAQRAMVGAKAREYYDSKAKERMSLGGGDKKSASAKSGPVRVPDPIHADARDEVAETVGVCGSSIDSATKVLKNGIPELVEAVEQGAIPIKTAARIASLPADAQEIELTRPKPGQEAPSDDEGLEKAEKSPVGILLAGDAVNCLARIPRHDAHRERGFQLVAEWIVKNK